MSFIFLEWMISTPLVLLVVDEDLLIVEGAGGSFSIGESGASGSITPGTELSTSTFLATNNQSMIYNSSTTQTRMMSLHYRKKIFIGI